MKFFNQLQLTNPEKCKDLFLKGEELVKLANNGNLRKLKDIVNQSEQGEILIYFVSKMYKASLLRCHLMITSFLIDGGYPVNSVYLPNVLNECLEEVIDYQGAAIIEFLASKGMDFNIQNKQTWETPLHIAIRRQLLQTVYLLVDHGSDVNAVAAQDAMPLTIAQSLSPSYEQRKIIEFLLQRNARSTWRKEGTVERRSFSGGGTQSTLVMVSNVTGCEVASISAVSEEGPQQRGRPLEEDEDRRVVAESSDGAAFLFSTEAEAEAEVEAEAEE